MKLVLIGGNPKGEAEPFSSKFLSGRRLREFVSAAGIEEALYFDIWKDQQEEQTGRVPDQVINQLYVFAFQGYTLIALGSRVQRALKGYAFALGIIPLPHPASRRPVDVQHLKTQLAQLEAIDIGKEFQKKMGGKVTVHLGPDYRRVFGQ